MADEMESETDTLRSTATAAGVMPTAISSLPQYIGAVTAFRARRAPDMASMKAGWFPGLSEACRGWDVTSIADTPQLLAAVRTSLHELLDPRHLNAQSRVFYGYLARRVAYGILTTPELDPADLEAVLSWWAVYPRDAPEERELRLALLLRGA